MNLFLLAAHLMADHEACVADCGFGRIEGPDRKCVDCIGACPKSKLNWSTTSRLALKLSEHVIEYTQISFRQY